MMLYIGVAILAGLAVCLLMLEVIEHLAKGRRERVLFPLIAVSGLTLIAADMIRRLF